jgi:ABC-type phosphate/phosphonate transport system permease subunit
MVSCQHSVGCITNENNVPDHVTSDYDKHTFTRLCVVTILFLLLWFSFKMSVVQPQYYIITCGFSDAEPQYKICS